MRQDESFYDDLVQEFYGLDSKTLAVDSVSITKSGKMHRWTEDEAKMLRYLRLHTRSNELRADISIILRPTVHLSALRNRHAVDG